MSKLSERISSAMSGVECPGCLKHVIPAFLDAAEGMQPAPEPDGRWSFVWRPTSGLVCPECKFPLGRHAQRLKWIRVFGLGVVVVTVSALLWVLQLFGGAGAGLRLMQRMLGVAGLVGILVGLAGIVVGGRRRS